MGKKRREFLAVVGSASVGARYLGTVEGRVGSHSRGAATKQEIGSASLLLNWRTSGLHVPYYAALEQGFYADEGLDLAEIESGQGSDFSAKQVGLGNTEFAITSSDQLLNINTRELSPRCVGIVMQRGPVVVFAAREQFGEELTDPEQLRDRTVGSGPGMVRQMTQSYLDRHGVLGNVEYVDTGFDTVQQLLTGEIDVAGGVFGDAVDARQQGYEIDVLSVHETIPSYGHVVATAEEYATDNPEAVRAFLRATARGAVWGNQNPEEAIDVLVDRQPELEEVRENQRAKWDLMRTDYMLSDVVRKNGWGWNRPEPWAQTYTVLEEGEFLDGEVDPETVWTNDYIDTDYEYIRDYADLVSD
jgi:NitT/TauT family transport system substrate-binding protein